MKKLLVMGLFLGGAACGGAAAGSGGGTTTPSEPSNVGSLTIRNDSSYGIYSLQLSPYDHPDWGQDLLAGDPLLPGEGGKVPVFDCQKYDLRMVDDENKECIINDIDLCFEDKD